MFKVCVVQINVSNMDEAIKFYCQKLGFNIKSKTYYPDIVDLDYNPVALILNKVNKNTEIDYPNEAQTLVNFKTDNLEDDIQRLTNKGVIFIHKKVQKFPQGLYAAFKDPFGNVFELVEFK